MKKILALLLTFALLFSLAPSASAALVNLYSDSTSGVTFLLPTGWTAEVDDYDEYTISFNDNQKDSDALMQFSSMDFWADLDSKSQSRYPRSKFDNDMFTGPEIAELLGVTSGTWTMVELNDTEFFLIETEESTVYGGFEFSVTVNYWVRIHNGWIYAYLFAGDTEGKLHVSFENVISNASYGTPSEPDTSDTESTYKSAVKAYRDGNYSKAEKLFKSVKSYKKSEDYLRLIRIRGYGENTRIGTGYSVSKHLTAEEMKDVDEAAKNVSFADTADVLMCNTDVASYFLFGYWDTCGGEYAYLQFHKDGYGGYYYTRSENLSTAVSDTVSINDGYVRLSVTSTNHLTFHITVLDADTIEVYSYEHCRTFTLVRN